MFYQFIHFFLVLFLKGERGKFCIENAGHEECELYKGTSRHHIIPYSDLRDFFNRALRSNNVNERRIFKNFIQRLVNQALLQNELTGNDITILIEQGIRSDMPIMRIPVLNLIISLHTDTLDRIRDRIRALYTWMPFVWFHGYDPRNRADDPNGGFETTAARITIKKDRNLEELRVLHRAIRLFVDSGNAFGHAIDLMNAMIDLSSRDDTDYGSFDPSDWIQVESKKNLSKFKIRPLIVTRTHDELKKKNARIRQYSIIAMTTIPFAEKQMPR